MLSTIIYVLIGMVLETYLHLGEKIKDAIKNLLNK
jgi:hypothetical protein